MSKIIANRSTDEQPEPRKKYEGDEYVIGSILLGVFILIVWYAIAKGN